MPGLRSSQLARLFPLTSVLGLLSLAPARAADTLPAPLAWNADGQGQFLTSLAKDAQGQVWIGTEDKGVWRYNPSASKDKQFTQFTSKDGLGDDNAYALACDRKGRIWAGTLNHGVSVFNGQSWKTYDPLTGPLGSRVFALATSPVDGDVWIATEAGLTRYSLAKDVWTYFTRADGLPSDQANALAFDRRGTLYVGTQCDGLAIASLADNYKTWRQVTGPEKMPATPGGAGLPTNLINCLLVSRLGTVYVGTTTGLARSEDNGRTWRFLRGADWSEKVAGIADTSNAHAGLVDQADLRGLEILPLDDPAEKPVRIAAGGSGTGDWSADEDFEGGDVFHTNDAVDTHAVPNPAPPAVYQSARWGSFAYHIPHLRPGASYRVRLHLAEVAWDRPGQRVFNAAINGKPVLTRFDIFASAGGRDKAIVREFDAKADGQGRISLAFRGAAPLLSETNSHALLEDYVTSLAEDEAGRLFIGHRRQGLEVVDEKTGARVPTPGLEKSPADFVSALLPLSGGPVLVGKYGGGLTAFGDSPKDAAPVAAAPQEIAALPSPAAPPTLAQLQTMLAKVQSLKGTLPVGGGAYLGEDWNTQGDSVGRYGRQYAVLCAARSPLDHRIQWTPGYSVFGQMGPQRLPDDSLRHWVNRVQTDEPKTLYDPIPGYRREAEWDDHGETYAPAFGGPGIWVSLRVPEGVHRVSLYFDETGRSPGFFGVSNRDYLLELKPYPKGNDLPLTAAGEVPAIDFAKDNPEAWPTVAQARVRDFWGGVYKQFVVRGPGQYLIKIDKNNSWNTMCAGVFIDKLMGPVSVFDGRPLSWMGGVQYAPPDANLPLPPDPHALDKLLAAKAKSGTALQEASIQHDTTTDMKAIQSAVQSLWSNLDADIGQTSIYQQPYRLLCYRAGASSGGTQQMQENWRWKLNIWTSQDREKFKRVMTESHQALLDSNPSMRGRDY